MGRKRFITSDMSIDEQIEAVAKKDYLSALLWPWLLLWFDDWGKQEASVSRIKLSIFPSINITIEQIAFALKLYEENSLIYTYTVGNKKYIAVNPASWLKYQTYLSGTKRHTNTSKFPMPPSPPWGIEAEMDLVKKMTRGQETPGISDRWQLPSRNGCCHPELAAMAVPSPSLSLSPSLSSLGSNECKDDVPKKEELTEEQLEATDGITEHERRILHELKQIPEYPFEFGNDLGHIRELIVDYPELDLLQEAKKWQTYKRDKPLAKKSNPRSQFRNWCKKAVEYQSKDKGGKGYGQSNSTRRRNVQSGGNYADIVIKS